MNLNNWHPTFLNTWNDLITNARRRDHTIIRPELLLAQLVHDQQAAKLLNMANVNVAHMEMQLYLYISNNEDEFHMRGKVTASEPYPDDTIDHIMCVAEQAARKEGRRVDGIDVLLAFYKVPTLASKFLNEFLKNTVAFGYTKEAGRNGLRVPGKDIMPMQRDAEFDDGRTKQQSNSLNMPRIDDDSALKKYCVNLMQKAKDGGIDPLIGRDEELERMVQVMNRRKKNNPILVGEPGVGKTAMAEGLAAKIMRGDVPDTMKNDFIFTLDLGALVAGAKYRGDFEGRIKEVLEELEKFSKRLGQRVPHEGRVPKVHIFIDEIHTMVGAGAASGGAMDASNLLKPALASGTLNCIGATTYNEYRQIFEKDGALARRFQKIDIPEPSQEETLEILKGLKGRYEKHHGVTYTDEALERAVQLAARYIHNVRLPDSAIDIIDEVGAQHANIPKDKRKEKIEIAEIDAVVARIARIPAMRLSNDDQKVLKTLDEEMKKAVFGQDNAIEAVVETVKQARAGMREQHKPSGSYLFSGPTGVGKTEITKQLAEKLGLELIRFDMSEYMERHAASRLVGAPPGYVGFDQGGLLTEEINKHPHSILLLDEIEKAHPDIFNMLLQVMDHGTLTDNNGRKADFRHVILIMTTNAGAADREKRSIGFHADRENETQNENQAVKTLFSPEFRNRLDGVVEFQNLKPEHMGLIVDKFIGELQGQLKEKNITITLEADARAWLANEGYDRLMGARPMGRVIQRYVKKPMTDEILFGALREGGNVTISFNKNAEDAGTAPLSFTFNSAAKTQDPARPLLALKGPQPKDP
ncbi:MAG: AAA family ATPase [Rhodospirillales bacterium]|nr:AAA family ATPase [Rhodospirillales bacterium]MCB9997215.1 AAA family ATPase [Rhodospirillales bacterium]